MLYCLWLQLRVLTLQISELERSIHTSKVSMPDLPGIDRDIASLKADLLRVSWGAGGGGHTQVVRQTVHALPVRAKLDAVASLGS